MSTYILARKTWAPEKYQGEGIELKDGEVYLLGPQGRIHGIFHLEPGDSIYLDGAKLIPDSSAPKPPPPTQKAK